MVMTQGDRGLRKREVSPPHESDGVSHREDLSFLYKKDNRFHSTDVPDLHAETPPVSTWYRKLEAEGEEGVNKLRNGNFLIRPPEHLLYLKQIPKEVPPLESAASIKVGASTFHIERVVEKGLNGRTYTALDDTSMKRVILKELVFTRDLRIFPQPGNLNWALGRFCKEATILGKLNDAHFPKLIRKNVIETDIVERKDSTQELPVAVIEKRFLIAMEYIEGYGLNKTWCNHLRQTQEHGSVAKTALKTSAELAGALSTLHEKDISHGDFHTGNIIVTPDGIPTVIDFGSAKEKATLSERQEDLKNMGNILNELFLSESSSTYLGHDLPEHFRITVREITTDLRSSQPSLNAESLRKQLENMANVL